MPMERLHERLVADYTEPDVFKVITVLKEFEGR